MKFFALLVIKGVIEKADVQRCLQVREKLAAKGQDVGLTDIALKLKLITRERLDLLKLSGGEKVPVMPGYELRGKVGEGGMSNVFHYHEAAEDRSVAVKILKGEPAADPKIRTSFLRESNILIDLDHPNVVKGYRAGTVKGQYVFIMEFIEGESLHDLIRKDMIFDEDAALYIILQSARAIEYMKSRNILHRDIKPGNLMLKRDNTVKLIDLGLATVLDGDKKGEGKAALSDTTLGTAHFISPEQARGQTDLDVRSDIYSLGATLYQLVLGELPFSGETDEDVMTKHILGTLSSKALKGRKVSPHMHYFIEKMMVKDRDIRYQDPLELVHDIEDKIRGKKTLHFRPDLEERDEEELLKGPYLEDDEDEEPRNSKKGGLIKGRSARSRRKKRR